MCPSAVAQLIKMILEKIKNLIMTLRWQKNLLLNKCPNLLDSWEDQLINKITQASLHHLLNLPRMSRDRRLQFPLMENQIIR